MPFPMPLRLSSPAFRTGCALSACVAAGLLVAACATGSSGSQHPMSFFVSSANPGQGANLGGLVGADRLCQSLASSVGAGGRTWHAYLSTSASGGQAAVNARERIGSGPWYNVQGVLIASSVDDLHSANNRISKQTALTEKGDTLSGRGDAVNQHDILTGSSTDGRAINDGKDNTCGNWTRGGTDGAAIVGHHDRMGPTSEAWAVSWNSSHPSKGCSLDALKSTGGNGRLYCFAVN